MFFYEPSPLDFEFDSWAAELVFDIDFFYKLWLCFTLLSKFFLLFYDGDQPCLLTKLFLLMDWLITGDSLLADLSFEFLLVKSDFWLVDLL